MNAADVYREGITLPPIPLADHTVHWPTGSYRCCKRHADGLKVLAGHLGFHLQVEELDDDVTTEQCITCLRELAQEAADAR